jgi:hypothetical protein
MNSTIRSAGSGRNCGRRAEATGCFGRRHWNRFNFPAWPPLDEAAFAHALEFSRFENMQAGEASGKFKESELVAGDPNDLAFAAEKMKALDARLGYSG